MCYGGIQRCSGGQASRQHPESHCEALPLNLRAEAALTSYALLMYTEINLCHLELLWQTVHAMAQIHSSPVELQMQGVLMKLVGC